MNGHPIQFSTRFKSSSTLKCATRTRIDVLNVFLFRWWGLSENCQIEQEEEGGDTTELNLGHVAGIFFVLIAGAAVALLMCIGEVIYRRRYPPPPEDENDKVKLLLELSKLIESELDERMSSPLP